jgi:hypothetical protein
MEKFSVWESLNLHQIQEDQAPQLHINSFYSLALPKPVGSTIWLPTTVNKGVHAFEHCSQHSYLGSRFREILRLLHCSVIEWYLACFFAELDSTRSLAWCRDSIGTVPGTELLRPHGLSESASRHFQRFESDKDSLCRALLFFGNGKKAVSTASGVVVDAAPLCTGH